VLRFTRSKHPERSLKIPYVVVYVTDHRYRHEVPPCSTIVS
jgi:hypothetical protein